jgi:type IV pilus assembly protein PilN
MQFTINLATRTYLDRRLVNRIGAAIGALLLLLLAWNINRAAWSFGELRRLRAENAAYESRLNSRPDGISEKEFTRLLGSIGFYNEIIARKSFNWLGLLEQLENATPEGIALSALTPDRKKGELKIEGHTKNFAQIKSYLDKLEDSKAFTSVLLLSHTEMTAGERTKGLSFSISCKAALR